MVTFEPLSEVMEPPPALNMRTPYMALAFEPGLGGIIEIAERELRGVNFDTFVGRGLSGALVVPTLAQAFGKFFAVVRKPGESTHSSYPIAGSLGKRWVFVDDFVSSGQTRMEVMRVIRSLEDPPYLWASDYVGTLAYQHGFFEAWEGRQPWHTE